MSELAEAARSGGSRMTVLGVIAIILGILAMLAPGLTGLSVAMLLGVLVVIAGVTRIGWAFGASSVGKGILLFVLGALMIMCGIALLANPLFAASALTIILAIYFVVDGIVELAAGIQLRSLSGSGWLIFRGDRFDPAGRDDLATVPAVGDMGHGHPAGHQAIPGRSHNDRRRFDHTINGKTAGCADCDEGLG